MFPFHPVAHMSLRRKIDERLARFAAVAERKRGREGERIRELERDVARLALLARALADVCLRKGLIRADELEQQLAETDFADGVFDAALDPKLVKPGSTRAARGSAKPEPRAPARKRR